MPEVIKECMERMGRVLPEMSDVMVARLTGYAEGYADRAEQEAAHGADHQGRSGEQA